MDDSKDFQLRYVGRRFDGKRLPVDVLADLPAFRDLMVAFAKDEWKKLNAGYVRVPRGFESSLTFDLVAIEPGSAVPKLNWRQDNTQANLPGFHDQLETIVHDSYLDIIRLIEDAANDTYPDSLSSEHIRALNKFGSRLQPGERIEFPGSRDSSGNVIFFDLERRKNLITHVRETYEATFEGVGTLLGSQVIDSTGTISIRTEQHGDITLQLDPDVILAEFDGHINADVQFEIVIELDHNNKLRSVTEVLHAGLYDPISQAQQRLFERAYHLSTLDDGWMDGEGQKISQKAIETGTFFIAVSYVTAGSYKLYPSENGGLLIEFEWNDWDYSVEIHPDGKIEMYGISLSGSEEMQSEIFKEVDKEFLKEFSSRTRT